jgi:hypothetical protein
MLAASSFRCDTLRALHRNPARGIKKFNWPGRGRRQRARRARAALLPKKPNDFDNGLLTASEVAQLKLNADFVVLSACNTAAGEKPGGLKELRRLPRRVVHRIYAGTRRGRLGRQLLGGRPLL